MQEVLSVNAIAVRACGVRACVRACVHGRFETHVLHLLCLRVCSLALHVCLHFGMDKWWEGMKPTLFA